MISDLDVASAINDLLLATNQRLIASLETVEPKCSAQEFLTYKRAVGVIVNDVFERILEPIYLQHPQLKPAELD